MKEFLWQIVAVIKRFRQKQLICRLVKYLPGDMQPEVLHKLLDVIDVPDRMEKVRRTRMIFQAVKAQLDNPYQEKLADINQEYSSRLSRAASNVIVPDLPMPRLSINHNVLEEKAKARLTLDCLEEEVMGIPHTSTFHLYMALLGILMSAVANFSTITARFGNDWIGGNELMSTLCNGFFSLAMCVFEAIGLYLFMHFMPKRYTNGFSRILGMVGALVIVVSLCIAIFSRVEVGTSVITPQDSGKVE